MENHIAVKNKSPTPTHNMNESHKPQGARKKPKPQGDTLCGSTDTQDSSALPDVRMTGAGANCTGIRGVLALGCCSPWCAPVIKITEPVWLLYVHFPMYTRGPKESRIF